MYFYGFSCSSHFKGGSPNSLADQRLIHPRWFIPAIDVFERIIHFTAITMKISAIIYLFRACALSGIGCSCLANINYVYTVFGLDIHFYQIAVSILGINIMIFLKELDLIQIRPGPPSAVFVFMEVILEIMILLPFVVTQDGKWIDFADADSLYWRELFVTILSIMLLKAFVYLVSSLSFK